MGDIEDTNHTLLEYVCIVVCKYRKSIKISKFVKCSMVINTIDKSKAENGDKGYEGYAF